MSSPLRTGRLYPQEYPCTHFQRLSRPRAHGLVGCFGKKIPSNTTGDRSRHLSTSSAQRLNHYATPDPGKQEREGEYGFFSVKL